MSLLQMSFSGGALILAIVVMRVLALDKLPKRAFFLLWIVAALRLLVPVSIPSPVSVYSLAAPEPAGTVEVTERIFPAIPAAIPAPSPAAARSPETPHIPVWQAVWLAGSLVCAAFFVVSYGKCRRRFRFSTPVEDKAASDWLAKRAIRRPLEIRQCGTVSAPLTYGIFRPVILLPETAEWGEQMGYVLEHELVHIQWFDAAWKLLFAAAVCVHWWNPLVWVMYALANRDIELGCDEAVIRRFGLGKRSAYALALIGMEEAKSGLPPLASGFSRHAIEERITAIMKMKKTSFAAMVLAAVLVCGVSVGFATSAADRPEDLGQHLTALSNFSEAERQKILSLSLWLDRYADMTVVDYQDKLWAMLDNPEDMELMERFLSEGIHLFPSVNEKQRQADASFTNYILNVYSPLVSEGWQRRSFSGPHDAYGISGNSGPDQEVSSSGCAILEYNYAISILDREALLVGEYETLHKDIRAGIEALMEERTEEELRDGAQMDALLLQELEALGARLSTGKAQVTVTNFLFQPMEGDPDAEFSGSIAGYWDRLLTPYTQFGLTYEFSDPDHDGNGLTMYYQGREVRGILDEQENAWITEHAGNGTYAGDAVELYAFYEDGRLAGLRLATAEEQAEWDSLREQNSASAMKYEEEREFPQATAEDYASFLELMKWEDEGLPAHASQAYRDYQDMTLEQFNQRLLDWGNRNPDAYDYIMCDAIWDDCGVELSEEEKRFVSLTFQLSGRENAMYVRSNYTGRPEEDPGFSEYLPDWTAVENGITTAWCALYYQCSYHIADKSAVTVRERDGCISGFRAGVLEFWNETEKDELLRMTEEELVSKLNGIAGEHGTKAVRINPITVEDVTFEAMDERGRT